MGSNSARARSCALRARDAFTCTVEHLPDQFTARLTRKVLVINVEGVDVPRATWRVWKALGWVFQIEGDQWGKLPAYERARWEE